MANSSKFLTGWKMRMALVLIVMFFMIGWRLLVIARQPPHLLDVANEISSVAQTRTGIYPNNDGSSLIYYQETETGLGTYFCETATGKTHLLFEEDEKGYGGHHRMLGWSPDYNLIAYYSNDPDSDTKQIAIYDGHTGNVVATLPASAYTYSSQFTWLSNRSFLYSTFEHRSWLIFGADYSGKWSETQVTKRFAPGQLRNLTVTSPHSISWLADGNILTYDFSTGASAKVWQANATNTVLNFTYSEETDNYLLNCIDKKGHVQIRYRPPNLMNKTGTTLEMVRNPEPAKYVDMKRNNGRFYFTIKTDEKSKPINFEWDGMLGYYGLGGNLLFFTGNQETNIPGIWQYDVVSKHLRQVVSARDAPLKWAKISERLSGVFTNKDGRVITYHYWQPTQKHSGTKYPVIIGKHLDLWDPFQQIASNAGWYFIAIDTTLDSADWNPHLFSQEILELHETVLKSLDIDTKRVFIIASSIQSSGADELFQEKPELAHGFIFYHPVGDEILSNVKNRDVLIFGGTDDRDEPVGTLEKIQDEALNNGNTVRLLIQKGVQHNMNRSLESEQELCREFARFLIEN